MKMAAGILSAIMIKKISGPASLLSLLFVLLAPPVALAQASGAKAKSSPYTLRDIVFRGDPPYTKSALVAITGLKLGAPLTTEDMQAAAERLVDTGAFDDVTATLEAPTATSINLVFTIKPVRPEHMLRASFDNFVWCTPEELRAELQRRVPLFRGSVPEGGNVQAAVQNALQQMLAAKGVTATVSSELVAPRPGQPFRMAEYRVTSPSIRIHRLDIAGVPPEFAAAMDKVVASLTGGAYQDGLTGGLTDRVLASYRDAGYLDAALSGLKSTVVSSTAERVEVDVTATLTAGESYLVTKLDWPGSPVMTSAAFQTAAKLHPGDVASQKALRDSLENLDAAYRDHGYMDVIVDAKPLLDTATRQVSYTVTATPGDQYRLRELTVLGLSPAQRKEFDSAWQLKPGDIYNAGYVVAFLKNDTVRPGLRYLTGAFKVTEEPEGGVLDLSITFKGGGR